MNLSKNKSLHLSVICSICLCLTACSNGLNWDKKSSKPRPTQTTRSQPAPAQQQPSSPSATQPNTLTTNKRHTGKRPAYHVVKSREGFWSIARYYGLTVAQVTEWNNMSKNDVIFKGMKLKLYPASTTNSRSAQPSASSRTASQANKTTTKIKLLWPLKGRVISNFNAKNRTIKGLEIGGLNGQRIKAAAAGTVVYAGSGLVGLGNVIIIKHDSTYITAYGHNEKLLKVEGDKVLQGDEIALIGQGPNNQTMLYFELRKNGQPVNPTTYLK